MHLCICIHTYILMYISIYMCVMTHTDMSQFWHIFWHWIRAVFKRNLNCWVDLFWAMLHTFFYHPCTWVSQKARGNGVYARPGEEKKKDRVVYIDGLSHAHERVTSRIQLSHAARMDELRVTCMDESRHSYKGIMSLSYMHMHIHILSYVHLCTHVCIIHSRNVTHSCTHLDESRMSHLYTHLDASYTHLDE